MELPYRFDGRALRELREKRNVSRQELARRSSLSRAYIYMLEGQGEAGNPARRPSYDVVLRLARALEVDASEFGSANVQADSSLLSGAAEDAERAPAALKEAAERFEISPEDVRQLLSFRFRGRVPKSASDWAYLWMAMRKSVGLDL